MPRKCVQRSLDKLHDLGHGRRNLYQLRSSQRRLLPGQLLLQWRLLQQVRKLHWPRQSMSKQPWRRQLFWQRLCLSWRYLRHTRQSLLRQRPGDQPGLHSRRCPMRDRLRQQHLPDLWCRECTLLRYGDCGRNPHLLHLKPGLSGRRWRRWWGDLHMRGLRHLGQGLLFESDLQCQPSLHGSWPGCDLPVGQAGFPSSHQPTTLASVEFERATTNRLSPAT